VGSCIQTLDYNSVLTSNKVDNQGVGCIYVGGLQAEPTAPPGWKGLPAAAHKNKSSNALFACCSGACIFEM